MLRARQLEEMIVVLGKTSDAPEVQHGGDWVSFISKVACGIVALVFTFSFVYMICERRNRRLDAIVQQQFEDRQRTKEEEEERAKKIKVLLRTMEWSQVAKEYPNLLKKNGNGDHDTARTASVSSGSDSSVKMDVSNTDPQDKDLESPPQRGGSVIYDVDQLIADVRKEIDTSDSESDALDISTASTEIKSSANKEATPEAETPESALEDVEMGTDDVVADIKPSSSLESDASKSKEDDDDEDCCYICLGPFEDTDMVAVSNNSKCTHFYHEECISNWLVKKDGCPVCRRDYLTDTFGFYKCSPGEESNC